MITLPIGLSTGCFYNASIFECLELIRYAGFAQIEICSFPAHLDYHDLDTVRRARAEIDRVGLTPYSFHAPFNEAIDITSPYAAVRETSFHEVQQACTAAAELGARHVVLHPGPEASHVPGAERMERLDYGVATVDRVARHCQKLGLGLVLENMLPHLFTGPIRELLWILGSLASTEVRVCLDTGHAFLSGDLDGAVHKLGGYLCMVHVNDNGGQRDDHLPPGQGKIDWRRLLQLLIRGHFEGMLMLELSGGRPADQILRGAREGGQLLQQIMGQLPPVGNSGAG